MIKAKKVGSRSHCLSPTMLEKSQRRVRGQSASVTAPEKTMKF